MYDIYIKNYCLRNGTYVTDETLMYSIPMAPNDDNALTDPKVTVEMGKAGSFEFTMNFWHPYYESLRQMKTIFRIVYDGDTIFRGRVLTIDTGHMTGVKKVHCEGDMAFLLDSQAEGIPDTTRPKTNALTYIQTLISNHNSQMANDMADKQFALGQVPGTYTSSITEPQQLHPDNDYRYGSSSWKDSQSAFVELSDSFGGFWRTRYQNGTTYLDWLDNYYDTTINPQIVEIGENILDISSSSEVNNIFTALIPVGSKGGKNLYINGYQTAIHGDNNYILVPQILRVFSDAELNSGFHSKHDYASAVNDYGMIFRTESFSNADTQEKLWQYATDWIKNNYCGGLAQFSVGAMDMHHVGESIGKYLLGGRVTVVYPDVDHRDTNPEAVIQKVMTVMKIVYNLNNPEKNQYTIGIPNAILKKNYGEKKKNKKGSGASSNKKQEQDEEHFENWKEYSKEIIWRHVQDTVTNSEAYAKYVQDYGEQAGADVTYASYVAVGDIANKVPGYSSQYNFGQMILNGHTGEMEFNGPINEQAIHMAQETGELTKSIIIGGLNKTGITINQALPHAALNWNKAQLEQFNNLSVAKLEADGTGSKLTFSTILGQSPTNIGEKRKSMLLDSADGHLTGMQLDLAGSLEEFEDVADKEMLGKIGLNGPGANLFTSADGENKNINMDGSGEGQAQVGKDGSSGEWRVKLNERVTYIDENHVEHVLEPGFVVASDFKIRDVDSFKTKLAVIDSLFVGTATIGQLQAVEADIAKITGDTIQADTQLRAVDIVGTTITGGTIVSTGTVAGTSVVGQNLGFVDSESGRYTYLDLKNVSIGGQFVDNLYLTGTGSAPTLAIPDAVTSITLSGPTNNTYYLHKTTYSDSTPQLVGSFSRATQLSGGWSSSGLAYTVTASPQAESDPDHAKLTLRLAMQTPTGTSESCNVNLVEFTSSDDPTQTTNRGSRTLYLKEKEGYSYITSADADPTSANTLAKKAITGGGQGGIESLSSYAWSTDVSDYNDWDAPVAGTIIYDAYYMFRALAKNGESKFIKFAAPADNGGIASLGTHAASFDPSDYADWEGSSLGTINYGGYYQIKAAPNSGAPAYVKFAAPPDRFTDGQRSVTLSGGDWDWDSDNEIMYAKVDASAPNTNSKTVYLPTFTMSQSGSTMRTYAQDSGGSRHQVASRSVSDPYNQSVTLTYRGAIDGVYTYTTSTYVSGLNTGSRYTVHFNK